MKLLKMFFELLMMYQRYKYDLKTNFEILKHEIKLEENEKLTSNRTNKTSK